MRICSGISTEWLFIHCFQVELEFWSGGFCGRRKTGEPGKNPQSRDENQPQTQPTHGLNSRIQTWATLVGGEDSYHCAIAAPPLTISLSCYCRRESSARSISGPALNRRWVVVVVVHSKGFLSSNIAIKLILNVRLINTKNKQHHMDILFSTIAFICMFTL